MVFTAKFYIGYSDINKDYNLTNTSLLKLFENQVLFRITE